MGEDDSDHQDIRESGDGEIVCAVLNEAIDALTGK